MEKIILFGAGFYGQSAYYKLKERFKILYFVDNDSILDGTRLLNVPVISVSKLKEVYSREMDIIICVKDYFRISTQLVEMGITEYYVMLEGFLYHSGSNETMMPIELNRYPWFHKTRGEKNILYVQNTVSDRAYKIAAMMKGLGYKVYLLYTLVSSEDNREKLVDVYDGTFTFYTADGIISFIENSDFDIIHSFNVSDILTNIVLMTSKHVVFDAGDNEEGCKTVEDLILEYVATLKSDGCVYASQNTAEMARKKYDLDGKEILLYDKSVLADELDIFYERIKQREIIR